MCSGGDGGGTKKQKEGRKKMDGAQEWDTRVLLAVPTSNAAASRRSNRKKSNRFLPICGLVGVPFPCLDAGVCRCNARLPIGVSTGTVWWRGRC